MDFEQEFKGRTVLITGHTGFKGGWLCAWLIRLGANVVGFSKDIPTNPSFFKESNIQNSLSDVRGDIRNPNDISAVIQKFAPDYIFHLAAQAIVSKSYLNPIETITTNIVGTANLLDALKNYPKKCSVVMVTSDKSYRNKEWAWGYREIDELGGSDIYSGSKSAAEMIINSYIKSFFDKDSIVRIGVARAGNVIGGGDWSLDRVIPDCYRAWSNNKGIKIRSPDSTRPWQHVLDPLSGYLTLGIKLSKGHMHGEDFNFGPNFGTTAFSVSTIISDLYKKWPKPIDELPFQVQSGEFKEAGLLKLNCDKALQLLGWYPACNYEETIALTSEWYRKFYEGEGDMMKITNAQISQYEMIARNRGSCWAKKSSK